MPVRGAVPEWILTKYVGNASYTLDLESLPSGEMLTVLIQWTCLTSYVPAGAGKRRNNKVVRAGEHIAEYPDDRPYPSSLILGYVGSRPVHVVVARDLKDDACYVVTAYVPHKSLWSDDFRTRREP
jgi:hypothetical protein